MTEETVCISKKDYEELKEDHELLKTIREYGIDVDEWRGYAKLINAIDSLE